MRVITELIDHLSRVGWLSDEELATLIDRGFLSEADRFDVHERSHSEPPAGDAGGYDDLDDARPSRPGRGHAEPPTNAPTPDQLRGELRRAQRTSSTAAPLRRLCGELRVATTTPFAEPQALRKCPPHDVTGALARLLDQGTLDLASAWPLLTEVAHVVPHIERRGHTMRAFDALVRTVGRDSYPTAYAWLLRSDVVAWALELIRLQRVLRGGLLDLVMRQPDRVGRWLQASGDHYAALVVLYSAHQDMAPAAIRQRYADGHVPQRHLPDLADADLAAEVAAFDAVSCIDFLARPVGSQRLLLTCPPSWDGATAPRPRTLFR